MILVIDESELLIGLLDPMLEGTGVVAKRAKDIPTAKRRLLEGIPALVLAFTKVGEDEEAGYRFCNELQNHPAFSDMPVLLFAQELTDTVIRRASDSGARGIAPWPISAESLIRRISTLIPELAAKRAEEERAAKNPPVPAPPSTGSGSVLPQAGTEKPAASSKSAASKKKGETAAPAQAAAALPVSELDKKVQVAQQILARVLYDLKKSDLLQVVDIDDVPQVVAELTRAACGQTVQEKEGRPQAQSPIHLSFEAPPPTLPAAEKSGGALPSVAKSSAPLPSAAKPGGASEGAVTGMDLDKIFGLKKT